MENAIIKAKKIECIIGLCLLLPSIIGVIAFIIDVITDYNILLNLGEFWTAIVDSDSTSMGSRYSDGCAADVSVGVGMSAAPIYLSLTAIAGGYLVKDSLHYLFEK